MAMNRILRITVATMALIAVSVVTGQAEDRKGPIWQRRQTRDKMGGMPEEILKLQSLEKVQPPSIDAAVSLALKAADEAARELIDLNFHKGKRITVPEDFQTIQSGIDAAKAGDIVIVKPGTYFELIEMKDGVKLVSDSGKGGDELVAVEGARLKLPRRTMRTIIDGSKSKTSHHGMIDFNPGLGRKTVVDGFTIQNLPMQDHHIPGHAHSINLRGASPVIMNCYVLRNGSTGIGSHVVFSDQESTMSGRDFRWANVRHRAEGVIYRNIIRESVGLGIGCNHFSAPHILGNEVFLNTDVELGHDPSPGMGAKHGAAPTILGNIVHDNPGGGILSKVGDPQGAHHIDRPTHPVVMKNVVYKNGDVRAAISCNGAGSEEVPVRFINNFVYDAGSVGIGISNGAFCVVEENIVSRTQNPGIVVNNATALKLNRNKVTGSMAPGFVFVKGAKVVEMIGNAADSNMGPRFMLHGSTVAGHDG
jgi:parallel beta-helix repeat protein